MLDPDPGDKQLINRVVSTAPGSSCPAGSPAAGCTSTVQVLVPALQITKTASTTEVVAGSPVQYTITVVNTGQTPYAPAVVTDSLAGVLDDAVYNDDAVASTGSVALTNGSLVWTTPLAVGATASLSYTATARFPATGDRVLRNTALSGSAGSSCLAGTPVTSCTTEVGVVIPALVLSKTADTTRVVAGGVVRYTIEATNTGQADYPAATFTDSLAEVLDDAAYGQDASASTGSVDVAAGTLTWSGALGRGATVVVTFSVKVNPTITGDAELRNAVVSPTVGSTCPAGPPGAGCQVVTEVEPSVLTLTDLTPSFTLIGPPGSTPQLDNAVTMTVTTNNAAGYAVTVSAADDALRSAVSSDTIPINLLSVRPSGTEAFSPFAPGGIVTVHSQDRPSAPGGDAVSNDYRVQIPFVASGDYSTTLEYIATSQ